MAKKKTGRGWHGDSQGHAEAGRKGGLASRKRRSSSSQDTQDNNMDQMSM